VVARGVVGEAAVSVDAGVGQRFGLGPIDQISFAVADVDEAVPRYTAMFGGPFNVIDIPPMEVSYRGRPSSCQLKLAFGRSGAVEVELVEVRSGDSPAGDFVRTRGEGLHHVRFPVSDLAATRAEMEAEGFEVTFAGGSADVGFAYLESPLLNGMTIELIQFPKG
jgi:methylmalonyl-CoA/ethylmalonyl-CoA epimerase